MKALQVHAFDAPIHMTNVDIPEPSQGQIRIKIAACGLNFADLLMQKGTYQDTPEPPFTLGMEVAGIVDAIGPDTDAPAVGSRVAVFGGQGGLAEFGCFDVDRMITLPDSMPFSDAAALQIAYGTSWGCWANRSRVGQIDGRPRDCSGPRSRQMCHRGTGRRRSCN